MRPGEERGRRGGCKVTTASTYVAGALPRNDDADRDVIPGGRVKRCRALGELVSVGLHHWRDIAVEPTEDVHAARRNPKTTK